MFGLIYPYGIVLQAIAILHFVRRRPETYWLWIILMFGGVGALIYIVVEVIPDAGLLRGTFQVFPRRKRIKELEGLVLDNPSIGNYEELGDLYLDDGQFARARECFDKVLAKAASIDPFYRRALCEIALNDFAAAAGDLERVVAQRCRSTTISAPRACSRTSSQSLVSATRPMRCSPTSLQTSTLSETQYNYACFPGRRRPPRRSARIGPSAFCGRKRRCPTTSAGASGRGFERRRGC